MVAKLEADTKYVEHVQDFWGDPLTEAGAQSNDGKAAYVQVYLAGNQGEALANESVAGGAETRRRASLPQPGVKVFVTGGSALAADQQIAGDRSVRIIEFATFGVIILMLLLVYRSISTVAHRAGDGGPRAVGDPRRGGVPRLSRPHRAVDVRDQSSRHPGDSGGNRLRDLPHRAISGGPHDR